MTGRRTMLLYVLVPPAAIVALVLLWLGVSFALSHVGGWSVLGERYATGAREGGTDLGVSSLTLDRGLIVVNYNRSVRLTLYPEGLGMETSGLFRRGHPPVLIPWSEIETCERTNLVTGTGTAVTLKGHRVNILVRGPAAEAVLAWWDKRARP